MRGVQRLSSRNPGLQAEPLFSCVRGAGVRGAGNKVLIVESFSVALNLETGAGRIGVFGGTRVKRSTRTGVFSKVGCESMLPLGKMIIFFRPENYYFFPSQKSPLFFFSSKIGLCTNIPFYYALTRS